MENINDNDNKSESKVATSKTTEVAETVEKPKKQKRKFEWTPKRKAAFEKCVAARKNQIEPKQKLKTIKEDDESSVSSADSSLSSSSEEYRKPRRKGLKKQFYRLKKDLIYNMKKHLKKKNVYDDDDLDYSDYLPPHYSSPFPTSRVPPQPQQYQRQVQEETEEEPPKAPPTKPKYCFV
jgi:hypothetical protein